MPAPVWHATQRLQPFKAKMKLALIPEKNYEKDLDEIPDEVKEALEIVPVKVIGDVLKEALL